jgi:hypothetical protein
MTPTFGCARNAQASNPPAAITVSHPRQKPTPTVSLSPLSATLTKIEGGLYRTATSFVGAQHAAPLTPRLPIRPPAAATPCPRREPTPTVSLTPLYAMLTKTRGVLIES